LSISWQLRFFCFLCWGAQLQSAPLIDRIT